MTTKTVPINNHEYTRLDSFPESAVDMQNISKHIVRLIFANDPPEKEDTAFYLIPPDKGIPRGGKSGDMYVMALGTLEGTTNVTVGE